MSISMYGKSFAEKTALQKGANYDRDLGDMERKYHRALDEIHRLQDIMIKCPECKKEFVNGNK